MVSPWICDILVRAYLSYCTHIPCKCTFLSPAQKVEAGDIVITMYFEINDKTHF